MLKIKITALSATVCLSFFVVANLVQALTFQEIYQYQTHQGQVLGASTPGVVQTKTGSDSNPISSVSFNSANTTGNLLVGIFTVVGDQSTSFTVSDTQGNTWQKASCNYFSSNGGYTICLMYAENAKAGANTVSANFNGDGRSILAEFSGVATTSSLDGTNSNHGTGATADSGNFVTTNPTDLLVGGVMSFGNTPSAGSNWTALASTDQYDWSEYRTVSSAGSYSASASVGGSDWLAVGAAFKAANAVGGDTQAPTIPTGLSATAVSSSAINLSWAASTDDVGVAGYKIFRGGVQIGTSATNSYSDSGLFASTNYSYTVSAYDVAANNSSQSASANATTQAPAGDATTPSTPTNLFATAVSSSQINLSWTASTDNVAVTGYKVYRNSSQIGTSATNSYSDTGLTASTQYTYTVSAYDAASNNSSQSTSANATTQAGGGGASGNIYLAQSSAGSNNGTSCANAYAYTFFNSSSNWAASGAGKITPGTVVHLCGTITGAAGSTLLTAQGNGSSGNPITILFEPGAVLTATYWSTATGAINLTNRSWITVDGAGAGGTNGIIQATANGTALANQKDDIGILIDATSHVTIRNLWIKDLYVRVANTSGGDGFDSAAITGTNATDILVEYSKFTNVKQGFGVAFNTAGQNWESSHNYFFAVEVPNVLATVTNGAVWTKALIHDCDFAGGVDQWDDPAQNSFHHDGMLHFWAQDGNQTAHINGVKVYNNYLHGVWGNDASYFSSTNGSHITTYVYPEQTGGDISIFNNVFDLTAGDVRYQSPDNGIIFCKSVNSPTMTCRIYNNTFIGHAGNSTYNVVVGTDSGGGNIIKNNLMLAQGLAYYWGGGSDTGNTVDYNVYYQIGTSGWNFNSFADWQSKGPDAHSKNGLNPSLDSSFKPQSGSSAIGAGVNLTSLGITELNSDKSGTARPASGAWDIGAYQSSGGSNPPPDTTPPAAPNGVRVD